jgi:hypothetical protein
MPTLQDLLEMSIEWGRFKVETALMMSLNHYLAASGSVLWLIRREDYVNFCNNFRIWCKKRIFPLTHIQINKQLRNQVRRSASCLTILVYSAVAKPIQDK